MKKYANRFWITFTVILSLLFIALFLPLAIETLGTGKAIVYTILALGIIWIVYFVRATVFSKNDRGNDGPDD